MIVLLDFQLMVMVFLLGKLQKLLQKKLEKKQYIKKERQLFSFNFQHLYIVFKCRNYFQNFNMCNSIPCFQMSNFIFCNISYISFFKFFFFFFHIFKQNQNLKALLAGQVKFQHLVKVLVYLVMLVKHPTLTKTPVKIVLLAHMN